MILQATRIGAHPAHCVAPAAVGLRIGGTASVRTAAGTACAAQVCWEGPRSASPLALEAHPCGGTCFFV